MTGGGSAQRVLRRTGSARRCHSTSGQPLDPGNGLSYLAELGRHVTWTVSETGTGGSRTSGTRTGENGTGTGTGANGTGTGESGTGESGTGTGESIRTRTGTRKSGGTRPSRVPVRTLGSLHSLDIIAVITRRAPGTERGGGGGGGDSSSVEDAPLRLSHLGVKVPPDVDSHCRLGSDEFLWIVKERGVGGEVKF